MTANPAAILSPAEYGRLRQIAHALKVSATAVEQDDWPRVQTIPANASRLRNEEV